MCFSMIVPCLESIDIYLEHRAHLRETPHSMLFDLINYSGIVECGCIFDHVATNYNKSKNLQFHLFTFWYPAMNNIGPMLFTNNNDLKKKEFQVIPFAIDSGEENKTLTFKNCFICKSQSNKRIISYNS